MSASVGQAITVELEVGENNSVYRGYIPSYPFIRPFIGFIPPPFIPCRAHLVGFSVSEILIDFAWVF